MLNEKNITINSILFINLIFAFFPISFILGNLIINLNLVLFCIFGVWLLRSKIFKFKFNNTLKIIFSFFLVVFFSTILSFIKSFYFQEYDESIITRLIKSVLFFRFFILLLVIYILSEYDFLNYKYFFVSSAFSAFIISADVVFQYTFGFNIVGLESYFHYNTSFFGDELISGGFIQNFAFFSILFFIYIFRNNKNYFKLILIPFLITLISLGIMVSGNRMPVVLFLLGLFLIYIFNKKIRKIVLASILIMPLVLSFVISSDNYWKSGYQSFYDNIQGTITGLFERMLSDEEEALLKEQKEYLVYHRDLSGHRKLISTATETWKLHRIFGNGIKSFREDCRKIIETQKRGICSNHPHNYYMEVLTDLGIVGLIVVIIIASMFLFYLFKNYRFLGKNNLHSLFLLAATISLFLEVFPIKSSGSIFTTNNATYIILVASVILSHKKLLEGKNLS